MSGWVWLVLFGPFLRTRIPSCHNDAAPRHARFSASGICRHGRSAGHPIVQIPSRTPQNLFPALRGGRQSDSHCQMPHKSVEFQRHHGDDRELELDQLTNISLYTFFSFFLFFFFFFLVKGAVKGRMLQMSIGKSCFNFIMRSRPY